MDSRKKVFDLLDQFRFVHDELDVILDRQKLSLENELIRPIQHKRERKKVPCDNKTDTEVFIANNENFERDSVSDELLFPSVMDRIQSFKRANEQHALILLRVLVDVEQCKEFMNH